MGLTNWCGGGAREEMDTTMAFCTMCASGVGRAGGSDAVCHRRRGFIQVAGVCAAGWGLSLVPGLTLPANAAARSLDLPATRGLDEPNDPKLPPYKNVSPGVAAQDVNVGEVRPQ
eukprot:Plantae.Rhodophyta-Purpureofilum_apyrenoidigerum.ctg56675.p1 GENE.Plantae.Rhodophyta-Purpureofilum_apyrenoidigerum.ctg56675~~Plantae.Rhodophyta-Purpureofilum_apyrenoidigerum.ctg56675.p1  ORF type:complete len:115 (+),score=8.74 Plantae.Rhodophyta-Purpureofilum_apyrenoidigerum.ctg56675:39-383(+)